MSESLRKPVFERTGIFFEQNGCRKSIFSYLCRQQFMDKYAKYELWAYAAAWGAVILGVLLFNPEGWQRILPYLLLFAVHNWILLDVLQKKRMLYLVLVAGLMAAFGYYCWATGMRPPEGDGPFGPEHPEGPHPANPEFLRWLIGLLLIAANLGVRFLIEFLRSQDHIHRLQQEIGRQAAAPKEAFITFQANHERLRIPVSGILYIEGFGAYVKVYQQDDPTPAIVLYSLKKLVDELPQDRFMRIHKSFIVNTGFILKGNKTALTLKDGTTLPIGEVYKAAVVERLHSI